MRGLYAQSAPRPKLALQNPRAGGFIGALLRLLLLLPLWLGLGAALGGALWLASFVEVVPDTPDLSVPLEGRASELWSTDGTRVGGLLRGRRPRVSYDELPAKVRFAFLAAEDDAFFEHDGFDPVATARAFLRNREAGRVVEGGSTLTQQVAKRYLTRTKTYDRKFVELLLARRIEATYPKRDILESYLNEVYLGSGAHGVRAASEIYFDKDLDELSWPEAAMLAAVASSPSSWSPYRNPKRALERRRLVLLRLSKLGVFPPDEAERLALEPLKLRQAWSGDEEIAPDAVVEVREQIKERHGQDAMTSGGYEATLSINPVAQAYARPALARGLERLDRRQGYRGPLAQLPQAAWPDLDRAVAQTYGLREGWQPIQGRPYLARVTAAEPRALRARLGGLELDIPYEGAAWASPYEKGSKRNEVQLDDLTTAFSVGDVILVAHDRWPYWDDPQARRADQEPAWIEGWRVAQAPRVEGVLLSAELDTGYVRAMLGGGDFDRSQYNRATRGCRQPGSVFKPIVYSRALQQGMTPATVLSDSPIKIEKEGGEVWAPKNADNDFNGFLLLRDALAQSRNLPSVEVFRHIGAADAADQAYRLGVTTPMTETEALSLGASCVKPWDLLRVYGAFARRGVRLEPRLLLTLRGPDGDILEDRGHFADPSAPLLARLDRLARAPQEPPVRALDEGVAYIMLQLLRAVVYAGTAYGATELDLPAAGKTGTTNAYDTWFVGFTQSVLSVVWVGSDNNERPVGATESGGSVALPIWLDYMRHALAGREQGALSGPLPDNVEIRRVDRELGLLSQPGEPGIDLPFLKGTAPELYAPDRKAKAVEKADRKAAEF